MKRTVLAFSLLCLLSMQAFSEDWHSKHRSEVSREVEEKVMEMRKKLTNDKDLKERLENVLELGRRLTICWRTHQRLSSEMKGERIDDPGILLAHKEKARAAMIEANAIFNAIIKADKIPCITENALSELSSLYIASNRHQLCVDTCLELLEKKNEIESQKCIGSESKYEIYRRLAQCHAALKNRSEAVHAYGNSILAAEHDWQWKRSVLNLIEYEPRLMIEKYRKLLDEKVSIALNKVLSGSEITIRLYPKKVDVTGQKPFPIGYLVQKKTNSTIDEACIVCQLLPDNESLNRPKGEYRASTRIEAGVRYGFSEPLFTRLPFSVGYLLIDQEVLEGTHVLLCVVDACPCNVEAVPPRPPNVFYRCNAVHVNVKYDERSIKP